VRLKNSHRKSTLINFAIAFLIRELLASWTGHPWDFEVWVRVGKHVALGGNPYTILQYDPLISFSPYKEMESIAYPPLAAYLFAASYLIYTSLNICNRFIYYFIIKQSMIFSDLVIGLMVYKYCKSDVAYLLWLYNTFGIIISSVWGAIDPISILFLFTSLILLLQGRYFLSGASLGIATAVKGFPIIFLPTIILHSIKEKKHNAVVEMLLGFTSAFIPSIVIPFIINNWSWNGFYNSSIYQVSLPVYGGISPLLVLEYIKEKIPPILHNIISILWLLVILAYYITLIINSRELIDSLLMTTTLFIMSRTFVSEPILLYPIFLAIADYSLHKRTVSLRRAISLSIIGLINLTANNTLLIRFAAPISIHAFNTDIFLNNTAPMATIRLALREAFALLLFQDMLAIVFDEEPLLYKVSRILRQIKYKTLTGYSLFFVSALTLGLGLDLTVISMITDWHYVLNNCYFLGWNLLSVYHLYLALFYIAWIVTITALRNGNMIIKVKTFLNLLIIAIFAAGLALPLFQYFRGEQILNGNDLLLIGDLTIDDRMFFVLTMSAISTLPGISGLDKLISKPYFKYRR